MCGIVGFAGRDAIDTERLRGMSDALTHRGPDDRGEWLAPDRAVGFGHRRLSIIDLSPGGHQPMTDGTGGLHVAFNGEIYNYLELRAELARLGHTFRSASDTEVLLEAYREWGEDFLRRLTGMFAMALYDERKRALYLARDRAGEKPLFLWQTARRVTFASELKAILSLPDAPRTLDRTALEQYLAWGYVPGESCILEGIRKLAPGSVMRVDVDSGATRTWRYWDLPVYSGNGAKPRAEELVERLDALLLESVRKQLIADVPVGILLSGGIDSSLVTAMAARISPKPVKTFTVSFPGHPQFDESPYARMVAEHFGTEHTELATPAAPVELMRELARQYDEPIADSSMVPTFLVSRLIRRHATVALGGDGGDELFAGYPSYTFATRFDLVRSLVPRFAHGGVASAVQRLPVTFRGRNALLALGDQGFESLARVNVYFGPAWRRKLLAFDGAGDPRAERERAALAAGATTMLQAAQRIDFRSYMVDDILVKVDRASMLTSLEVRAPFLDHSVIEFAFGRVPDRLKANLRERKILLRRLAAKLLPPQLDLQRKQGFAIPLSAWLTGEWGRFLRDVLESADPSIFRREAIDELFAGHEKSGDQAHRLFALAIFELWRREYGISLE
ncbi:MAG TPA: asparagine synthase (glutamine-hydrolyzing) [Thermoanaerobaculia bacterium]|nr:asparagine synthase (glutamine-hydrolyzing) [Thermoanaerobaculia bacterium]